MAFHPSARGRAMVDRDRAAAEQDRLHRGRLEHLPQWSVVGFRSRRFKPCRRISDGDSPSMPSEST